LRGWYLNPDFAHSHDDLHSDLISTTAAGDNDYDDLASDTQCTQCTQCDTEDDTQGCAHTEDDGPQGCDTENDERGGCSNNNADTNTLSHSHSNDHANDHFDPVLEDIPESNAVIFEETPDFLDTCDTTEVTAVTTEVVTTAPDAVTTVTTSVDGGDGRLPDESSPDSAQPDMWDKAFTVGNIPEFEPTEDDENMSRAMRDKILRKKQVSELKKQVSVSLKMQQEMQEQAKFATGARCAETDVDAPKNRVCIMGSILTTDLKCTKGDGEQMQKIIGGKSPYGSMFRSNENLQCVSLSEEAREALQHKFINECKRLGPQPELQKDFFEFIKATLMPENSNCADGCASMIADYVVLACTELPLMLTNEHQKKLESLGMVVIDPNAALAEELLRSADYI
jgi:hypothetical protein